MSNLNDLVYRTLEAASPSGAITTRNETSKAIQDGTFYVCIEDLLDIPAAGSKGVLIEVGSEIAAILQVTLQGQVSEITISMYEDNTSVTGVMGRCMNLNRLYPVPDPLKNTHLSVPAVLVLDGTLLFTWRILGQNNGGNIGDVILDEVDGPIVMKPNTKYLFVINNSSASSGSIVASFRYIDR